MKQMMKESTTLRMNAQCLWSNRLPGIPPRKRQRLDVPRRVQQQCRNENQIEELKRALEDVKKLIKSKKTMFLGGLQGLQARRTKAIQSHLRLVVKNRRHFTDVSERAAEVHGFAAKWGGRQLHGWTRRWLITRELLKSRQGRHAKVYSLLSDPVIATELRDYVRSNKWAMNPEKLVQFTNNKLVASAADKYLHQIIHDEMPQGLKQYMEYKLFPRIHLKELTIPPENYVERRLVLIAHDEMTAQENDLKAKNWVLEDQHALRKKGVGRGIHKSDVICSTVGHLKEASQTLEYGKNYDGYWTGELFVKQIIPAFENAHGAGCRLPGTTVPGSRIFWGQVKKYLRNNCDYTFETLKDNMPKALASVPLNTIRRWEHWMQRWMEAYRMGLGTSDAQLQVEKFSSTQYKSHRRIPETVAQAFN
ncbi:hypothetical protein BV22DRAFT_1108607 [Leucogyrophana mollusca]|uniref:Uncharacterized protein n=1 Tax=Leucogyrophana mollusca TaxID=85980 RepID=A0ACB8AVH7_9AGAM|nr:hypothetical protein BV22DRAFT_1108607 [Leucogyrophana mollusca]